jgi:hypothetical protein
MKNSSKNKLDSIDSQFIEKDNLQKPQAYNDKNLPLKNSSNLNTNSNNINVE